MFGEQEEHIRELVRRTRAPVLGLLGSLIPITARNAIQADLRESPSAKAFAQRLDQFPALFAVWLAEHVMKGIGSSGHFDVYPHIQKALGGVPDLSTPERELLWRAFRRAMLKLGIQPLPRTYGNHYMVDEYVRQAGVPLAFADDLAFRMLQLAKRIGLPDEEDQEGLLTWQAALLNRLHPPFSATARKAVERDAQAYYTRSFLRVYAYQGVPSADEPLEEALAKAFVREGGCGNIKRASIPQLLYRDGLIGLFFASKSAETHYEVRCGGRTDSLTTGTEACFRPLPSDLPSEVEVLGSDGERLLAAKLWPDRTSNRLLIFNDAGRLRASAQLGQPEPIELPPGQYVALCRFSPTNIEDYEEVSEEPQLVEAQVTLRPGLDVAIENGPRRLVLAGQNVPTFRLDGAAKAGLERDEFHYGPLRALIEIPEEWRRAGQQSYELRVSASNSACRIPVSLDAEGAAVCRLDEALTVVGLRPGMWRVVVELARIGDMRSLQRQSTLYWHGLQTISYALRFGYASRPENIIDSGCSGVKIGLTLAEPSADASRVIRMAFDLAGGRLVHFSWNRPGVFVEVEIHSTDGVSTLIPKSLGVTETVSLTSQKNIIISASEPGYICLGAWKQFVDFGHRPTKTFSAAFLASRLEPGARTLVYETKNGAASIGLLELSQPHVTTAVSTARLGNVFEILLTVRGEPTAVAVCGKELGSGHTARAEHELLAGTWNSNELARMQVYSAADGPSHFIYILLEVTTLAPGLWTLSFEARIGGLWGRLEDVEEGRMAVAFAVDAEGHEMSGAQFVSAAKDLEERAALRHLNLLTEHFQDYWSPVCAQQQGWLRLYWNALIHRFKDDVERHISELVDMAMVSVPEDVRLGFQPAQSVGAMLPNIYCLPRAEYRKVHSKPHPLSVALRAMPELGGSIVGAFGSTLHQSVAMSFANVRDIMRGLRPKGFSLAGYRQTLCITPLENPSRLDDENFVPEVGDLLGPLHLAHAWRDLERRYESSTAMPASGKAHAIALARYLLQQSSTFGEWAPTGLRGQKVVLQLKAFSPDGLDEVEQLRQETLVRIANACSWMAWYCRLESRREGSLSRHYANLNLLRMRVSEHAASVTDCVAYYLHVAPAMFAYHLLLWELVQSVDLDSVFEHV